MKKRKVVRAEHSPKNSNGERLLLWRLSARAVYPVLLTYSNVNKQHTRRAVQIRGYGTLVVLRHP